MPFKVIRFRRRSGLENLTLFFQVCVVFSRTRIAFPKILEAKHRIYVTLGEISYRVTIFSTIIDEKWVLPIQ